MTFAHVQTPAGGAANGSATSISVSMPSVGAGHLLVVYWRYSNGGRTVTVSDNKSNSWTSSAIAEADPNDSGSTVGIAWAQNVASGTTSVTFAISGGALNLRMACSEFSTSGGTISVDQTAVGESITDNPTTATSPTPTTDGQLFAVVCHTQLSVTYTAGTDFTIATTVPTGGGSQRLGAEYFVQATAGAHVGNFTAASVNSYAIALATFKETAGGTTLNMGGPVLIV